MITVSELILEAQKPVAGHVVHVLTGQVTNDAVANLADVMKASGRKHIFHTSDVNDVTKKQFQTAVGNNHSHFFHKDGEVKTVFDAVDKIQNDGKDVTVMTHPSQVGDLRDSFKKTHPNRRVKVKALPHEKEPIYKDKKDIDKIHPSITRADAKKILTDSIEIGDFVTNGKLIGEVINIHPKYAVIVSEGIEHRLWLEELEYTETVSKQDRIYKESFTFRGYKSKHLTRELAEQFREKSKETEDVFGLLNCLKSTDFIMGTTTETIIENFKNTRIQLERAKRYTNKFSINITEKIGFVEESCLQYAILEDISFTTTDKLMVSRVVSYVAEVEPKGIDPTTIINMAIIKLRLSQLTPPGWKIVGRLLKIATKAGIKYNKDAFSKAQQSMMGI